MSQKGIFAGNLATNLRASALVFWSRPKKQKPTIAKKDVVKEGWLEKQSLHLKEWKERWCVLTPHFLLTFETASDDYRNPTEFLRICKCATPEVADADTARTFSFQVSTPGRTFFLVAKTEEDRDSWIGHISEQFTFSWEPVKHGDPFPERTVYDIRPADDSADAIRDLIYVGRNSKGECGKMTSSEGRVDEIFVHHGGREQEGYALVTREGTNVRWVAVKRGDMLPADAVFSGHTISDGDVYVARCMQGEFGKLNLNEGCMHSIWCPQGGLKQEGQVLCVSLDRARDGGSMECASPTGGTRSTSAPEMFPEEGAMASALSNGSDTTSGAEDHQAFLRALEPKMNAAAQLAWWRSQLVDLTAQGQQGYAYADPPVDAILGEGAYGKVWLAQHRYTNELYAVKNMKSRNAASMRDAIAKNELAVAETIREQPHPCIVGLYLVEHFDLREAGALYMLVMEYCPYRDLLKKITECRAAGGYTPPAKLLMWMGHIFMALEHLHLTVESLVRDLKPANVVISRSGCAKLTDFGYGKLFTDSDGTWTYACPPGSPGYIAPEVISQEPYNYTADFYSLGAMLWVGFSGGWRGLPKEPAPPVSSGKDFNSYKKDWQTLHQALQNPGMGQIPISEQAVELISQLTRRDPSARPNHDGIRESRLFRQLELPERGAAPGAVVAWQPPSTACL